MKLFDVVKILIFKYNYLLLRVLNYKTRINGHLCVCHVKVNDKGNGNSIITGRHVLLNRCEFNFKGNHHEVIFGDNINICNVSFNFEKDNAKIIIGTGVWIGAGCELTAMAGTTLRIGTYTLLAPNCHVRTSDSHYIYHDGLEINKPQDIVIGNHCWLGEQVFVLKGSKIDDGCVVGARSVVTSKSTCEPNCILVGNPAKIVKKNISWKL